MLGGEDNDQSHLTQCGLMIAVICEAAITKLFEMPANHHHICNYSLHHLLSHRHHWLNLYDQIHLKPKQKASNYTGTISDVTDELITG